MKKKKRAGIWLTAVLLSLAVSACTNKGTLISAEGESSGKLSKEATEPETKPLKVGIGIYKFDDDFMNLYRKELETYLSSEYQAEAVIKDAKGDQELQNTQIDEFLEEGCDVLILNLVDASETKTAADRCGAVGVPVVFINREPEEEEIKRWKKEEIPASYVGADARQSGTYQGEIILETWNQGDVNGDGTVSYAMIQGDEENIDARYRSEYSIKALKDGGMKTEELFCQRGNWEERQGRKLAAEALEQYGNDMEVIFCNNDAMANGAKDAIEAAGRIVGKDIYLVGVDALEETVGYVKEGSVTGTVWNDYVKQSHTAADIAVKMAAGGKVHTKYTVDYVKIVGETAKGERPTEETDTLEETAPSA